MTTWNGYPNKPMIYFEEKLWHKEEDKTYQQDSWVDNFDKV
jgi:hypothetical protein